MREILFRGKRLDNGEWVEGIPINTHIGTFIVFEENPHFCDQYGYMEIDGLAKVDPSTVGQYTGLTDKNGKRIFEGDICRNKKTGEIVSVKWHGTMACFVWSMREENSYLSDFGALFRAHDKYEVIGNIHDNQELQEGGADNG